MKRRYFAKPHCEDARRCRADVWIPDTYRRTGRGPSGFEMHYNIRRCVRVGKHDGYCWQHKILAHPIPS